MTTNIVDATFTGKNIATAVSVHEYTAIANCYLGFQVRLAAVAGGGDYICYLTLNDGDVQSDDIVTSKITYAAAAGETAFWFADLAVDVMAGDVVNVFVKGLAGDTNEAGSIRIFADNYSTHSVADIWNALTSGITTDNSIGKQIKDNLDAAIGTLSTYMSVFLAKDADVLEIKAVTDQFVFTVANQVDANVLSGGGSGSGAISKTVTVTVLGEPRDGVEVWVSTDSAGVNVVANGVTDAFGNVTFLLDTGSYYVWKQLAGVNFTNPQNLEV